MVWTEYDASHDQNGILCQCSDDIAFLDCCGGIQLWQDPIVFLVFEQLGTPAEPTLRSPSSASNGSRSCQRSFVPFTVSTITITWTGDGWKADSIKLSAMTIFTRLTDERFAVISSNS